MKPFQVPKWGRNTLKRRINEMISVKYYLFRKTENLNQIELAKTVTLPSLEKTQNPVNQCVYRVCPYLGWESNPHSRKNRILNPARLPIPPPRQFAVCKTKKIILPATEIMADLCFCDSDNCVNLHLLSNEGVSEIT